MIKKVLAVLIGFPLGGSIFVACQYWPQETEPELLSGNIEMTTVDITFPVSGRLVEILPEEGVTVGRGDLLARLDSVQMTSRQSQVDAQIRSIERRQERG